MARFTAVLSIVVLFLLITAFVLHTVRGNSIASIGHRDDLEYAVGEINDREADLAGQDRVEDNSTRSENELRDDDNVDEEGSQESPQNGVPGEQDPENADQLSEQAGSVSDNDGSNDTAADNYWDNIEETQGDSTDSYWDNLEERQSDLADDYWDNIGGQQNNDYDEYWDNLENEDVYDEYWDNH